MLKVTWRRLVLSCALVCSGAGSTVAMLSAPAGAVSAPTVTGISPTIGSAAGGTSVTISGSGFVVGGYETIVTFSPIGRSPNVYCTSTTSCTAEAPPGHGTVNVEVQVDGQPDTQITTFTYGPTITSVSPSSGSEQGGSAVEITGTGFSATRGTTTVDFGTVPATDVACSLDFCNVTTPAAIAPGTVDVTASVGGVPSPKSGADRYTYNGSAPTPANHGYWLVGSDGGIFSFGDAQFQGSAAAVHLVRPIIGIAPTSDRQGYWLVASDGGLFRFGDASYYGSVPGDGYYAAGTPGPVKKLNAPIVGVVPTVDDLGYFMVGADGGVFTFGDAKYEGSCPQIGGCLGAAVAVMPDASGNGYWVVTNSGHVYPFGDAVSYGAPGPQIVPVTSAVRTPSGLGYLILFANGAVAPYGDAPPLGGPLGQVGGSNPATAIFTTSDGFGYWVATANGSVHPYGDAPNYGGMSGTALNGPIIAATGS
jgi:IPT/TIG domain-containing protein